MNILNSSIFRRALALCAAMLLAFIAMGAREAAKRFTLVIDPGHGGHDAGAVGAFSKEKNINLKVALEFGRLVEANCPDVRVIYTRKTDVFIPLQERAEIANRNKADLFVSIHTNALPNGKIAYGSETYTLGMAKAADNLEVAKRENSVITYEKGYKQTYKGFDPNKAESYIIFEYMQDRYMKQSVELARAIQQQYSREGRKNKGVHQAGFLVLRATTMPSVLTEVGFISTPEEERYLNSAAGVAALGRSIYNGFRAYRKQNDRADADVPALNREVIKQEISVAEAEQPATPPADITPTGMSEVRNALAVNTPAAAEPAVVPVFTAPYSAPAPHEAPMSAPLRPAMPTQQAPQPAPQQDSQLAPQPAQSHPQQAEPDPALAIEAHSNVQQAAASAQPDADGRPVFKIQLLTSSRKLSEGDPHFKGLAPIGCYKDGGIYKYTYGEDTDYNVVRRLQKDVADKLTGTFIVAFINGERADLQEAIRIAKQK